MRPGLICTDHPIIQHVYIDKERGTAVRKNAERAPARPLNGKSWGPAAAGQDKFEAPLGIHEPHNRLLMKASGLHRRS